MFFPRVFTYDRVRTTEMRHYFILYIIQAFFAIVNIVVIYIRYT